ncbi:MAG: CpaD family pilus assembly lipoprotein [Alphaproteobacteria bacterium]|nr:CpaD family pilus assembly lipoprotein [Alphaproteobacteria bacterium]
MMVCRDNELRHRAARGRAWIHGLLLAATIGLAGCMENPDKYLGWIDTSSPHDPQALVNRVQWSEFSHAVRFPRGRSSLTKEAAREIQRFLDRERVGPPDQVIVLSRPQMANAKRDRLAARRELVVRDYLIDRRFDPDYQSSGVSGPEANVGGKDSVLVLVRRPLVQTPHCPDWRRRGTGEELVGGAGQFGCMTTTALGAMASDPNDLVEGREIGPADGTVSSRAVNKYRTGKVKKAKKQNTQKGK